MSTTFGVGDMTIHRIIEQEVPFVDALTFFPGLTPELLAENRPWLEPAALDPASGMVVLCFQSYVVRTPHHTVLVDSCIGNHKDRSTRPPWHLKTDETYMRALAAAGMSVDDIDIVMCTHLHADHVGWNTRLADGRWIPTFPKARYLFADREYAYWTERHAKTPIGCIADSVLPIMEAKRAELVRSDHVLDDHIRLMPTPGHTPDHFAVCLGRGGTEAVLTGDAIHSPLQARYPELSMFSDYDPKLAATTRRRFLERFCDTNTLFCTAHFPSPSAGHLTRWGDGFRCVPLSG
jgi:glyoxylase-like metal-dependent hydrolase (beta-lactamase superfamily II)